MDFFSITPHVISVDALTAQVQTPLAGATVVFIGTTRTPYEEKHVIHLKYECYQEMAIKKLKQIGLKAKSKFDLLFVAIQHRIGTVAVGEASVVVVLSAVHRLEAYNANEWIMNEIKATVPIWKKEVYKDGTDIWKVNSECKCSHNDHEL
jgi:molybdopterin synthase catalytic subunit